jgi:hypothetical protein
VVLSLLAKLLQERVAGPIGCFEQRLAVGAKIDVPGDLVGIGVGQLSGSEGDEHVSVGTMAGHDWTSPFDVTDPL